MTNQEQRKEIQQYLLGQNMAVNVMIEVSDHMISQVDELMFDGKTYEEAFAIVKENWRKELEIIVWNNEKKISRIQVNIIDYTKKSINRQSYYLTLGAVVLIFGGARVVPLEHFKNMYCFLLAVLLFVPTISIVNEY